MKEHYAAALKRELAESERQRIIAVSALKQIALERTTDAAASADTALKQIGFVAFSTDANIPEDVVFVISNAFNANEKADFYL